jgi:hypothetical protein
MNNDNLINTEYFLIFSIEHNTHFSNFPSDYKNDGTVNLYDFLFLVTKQDTHFD